MCKAFTEANTCEANASLNSTRSISSTVKRVRFNSFLTAGIGPIPSKLGTTPTLVASLKINFGINPSDKHFSSDIIKTALAPSLMAQAFPRSEEHTSELQSLGHLV